MRENEWFWTVGGAGQWVAPHSAWIRTACGTGQGTAPEHGTDLRAPAFTVLHKKHFTAPYFIFYLLYV
jgi:hypothetical protein